MATATGRRSVPLTEMAVHVDRGAQAFRSLEREAALERLHVALDKMLGIEEALSEEDWGGLLVPHKYMGPLPAFFYPVLPAGRLRRAQLGHPRGQRQAARARGPRRRPAGPAVLRAVDRDREGRAGHEADGARGPHPLRRERRRHPHHGRPEGLTTSADSIADVPTVIDFDPASFVLTAYGRMNAGTVHGDRELGHEFLDGFFRI